MCSFQIQIVFTVFDVQYGANDCEYDYVKVYDGDTEAAPLMGKFCGTNLPPVLQSTDIFLYITFGSDATINAGGYSLIWEPRGMELLKK